MNANFEKALKLGHIEPVMSDENTHFEIEGKKFYQPTESGAKMTIARFHSALDIIRMHEELKLSAEMSKSAWKQVKEIATIIVTSVDELQIRDAALDLLSLEGRIQARMDFGRDIEQVYQLTALYFITEEEDPGYINQDIINRKIQQFKAKPEHYAFFLNMPLTRFLGSSLALDFDTLNYLKEMNIQELLDLKIFHLKSQMIGVSKDTINYTSSRMETLSESAGLLNSLLSITSTSLPDSSATKEKQL